MRSYYVHLPGMAQAVTQHGANEKDALRRFKKNNGLTRMPAGFAIWEA